MPVVEGAAAAWLEMPAARAAHRRRLRHVFGEVVSAQADDRVFANGRWSFRTDNTEWHTLHHLGAGAFAVPSRVLQGTLLKG